MQPPQFPQGQQNQNQKASVQPHERNNPPPEAAPSADEQAYRTTRPKTSTENRQDLSKIFQATEIDG